VVETANELDHFRANDTEKVRINTHSKLGCQVMVARRYFVLSGVFRDEHGAYPAHAWMHSPHLSQHHPFVNESTVILVKTGHLPTA